MLHVSPLFIQNFAVSSQIRARGSSLRVRLQNPTTLSYLASVTIIIIRVPFPFPWPSRRHPLPVYLQLTSKKFYSCCTFLPITFSSAGSLANIRLSTIDSAENWFQSKVKHPFLHNVGVSCPIIVEVQEKV